MYEVSTTITWGYHVRMAIILGNRFRNIPRQNYHNKGEYAGMDGFKIVINEVMILSFHSSTKQLA